MEEVHELKLSGFTLGETHDEPKRRHIKVSAEKTVRKYYDMDAAPGDDHADVRKDMAFSHEPFASAILDILELNPDCYMSSVYDVLVERLVEGGAVDRMPGNEQTPRNHIRRLDGVSVRSGGTEVASLS